MITKTFPNVSVNLPFLMKRFGFAIYATLLSPRLLLTAVYHLFETQDNVKLVYFA